MIIIAKVTPRIVDTREVRDRADRDVPAANRHRAHHGVTRGRGHASEQVRDHTVAGVPTHKQIDHLDLRGGYVHRLQHAT
jgi:hypothetical protein